MAASRGEHNEQSQCVFHTVAPALGVLHPIDYADYGTLLVLLVVVHRLAQPIASSFPFGQLYLWYVVAISSETVAN